MSWEYLFIIVVTILLARWRMCLGPSSSDDGQTECWWQLPRQLGSSSFGRIDGDSLGSRVLHVATLPMLARSFMSFTKAWNMGYRSVECESDSLVSLNLIVQEGVGQHPMAAIIINLIQSFKTRQCQLSFNHVYREASICANSLARHDSFKIDKC